MNNTPEPWVQEKAGVENGWTDQGNKNNDDNRCWQGISKSFQDAKLNVRKYVYCLQSCEAAPSVCGMKCKETKMGTIVNLELRNASWRKMNVAPELMLHHFPPRGNAVLALAWRATSCGLTSLGATFNNSSLAVCVLLLPGLSWVWRAKNYFAAQMQRCFKDAGMRKTLNGRLMGRSKNGKFILFYHLFLFFCLFVDPLSKDTERYVITFG